MESKKISQLATELAPDLSDLTIIGDPTTGISKKITLSQMASLFTGTVEEYANLAAFPLVGVADTIYIALDTNVLYRWDTGLTSYVELSPNIINSLVFSDANGFDGNISLVGSVATLTITTALTTGSVGFIGASGALLQDNANFFWDDTNNRLGINTNAPTTALDVFGSGIIGRINGTSTNNAYLGFSSAGTNKWSVGNVQSDHRFRIFSEANSAELVSVLQTGEFGIGIANPTTKFHIDGAASALIANLDANVSVAKSISFRSDNSNRINLEVSGTESGSNAGANFFLRTYTDAGSLIETPLSIVRSTGVTTIKSLTLTNVLSVANGGTGSATQNFVDLTTTQSIGGAKTFTSALAGTSATFTTTGNAVTITSSSSASNVQLKVNNGSSGDIYAGVAASDGSSVFTGTTAYSGYIGTNLNVPFYIATNGSTKMTITGAGNVGIGVVPTQSAALTFADSLSQKILLNNNANNYRIDLAAAVSGGDAMIKFIAGSLTAGEVGFYTTSNLRMLITSGGNVGIGTSTFTYSAAGRGYLAINGTSDSILEFKVNNIASSYLISGPTQLEINANDSRNIQFNTNSNERMRITSGGDVFVGFSGSAAGQRLRVQGADSGSVNYSLVVANSTTASTFLVRNDGAVQVVGSLSKGSGSFRIDHPLESMTETHQLVHSFIEGPRVDLIYRGKLTLVNGKAQANIDEVATMTEGTFEVLCREVQCFTTNESGWDLVKGKVIDNIIYIESQNSKSSDEISWMVIGERKDKHILETDWTDENGKVIVEPLKPIKEEIIEQEIIENINEE